MDKRFISYYENVGYTTEIEDKCTGKELSIGEVLNTLNNLNSENQKLKNQLDLKKQDMCLYCRYHSYNVKEKVVKPFCRKYEKNITNESTCNNFVMDLDDDRFVFDEIDEETIVDTLTGKKYWLVGNAEFINLVNDIVYENNELRKENKKLLLEKG